eukprot:7379358-Prymnesium_polylepis.1
MSSPPTPDTKYESVMRTTPCEFRADRCVSRSYFFARLFSMKTAVIMRLALRVVKMIAFADVPSILPWVCG